MIIFILSSVAVVGSILAIVFSIQSICYNLRLQKILKGGS